MKIVFSILALAPIMAFFTQDQYTKGIQKGFQLWGEEKTTEASNIFRRISSATIGNRLEHYRVSLLNSLGFFEEKNKVKLIQ